MQESESEPPVQCETYWGRSVYDAEVPWHLSWVAGGGYFTISTKPFSAGDRILLEHPTTWTKAWHPFSQDDMMRIELKVEDLCPDEREAFHAMSNMYPDVTPASAGIYMTNSFDMPSYDSTEEDEEPQHASGMFLAIGRLNHSCVPNAQQTYIPKENDPNPPGKANVDSGYEVLYATRSIAPGEELCDCYIELRQSTELRRKELQKHYRFICTCPACGPRDEEISAEQLKTRKESDSRRTRALKLEQDMLSYAEMGEVSMAVDLGVELVKLLEHEKSLGWGERYIAEACVNTAMLLQETSQARRALEYVEKAHVWNVRLQGAQSADSVTTANRIAQMKLSMMMMGKKKK